jgi:hypothetical protein
MCIAATLFADRSAQMKQRSEDAPTIDPSRLVSVALGLLVALEARSAADRFFASIGRLG